MVNCCWVGFKWAIALAVVAGAAAAFFFYRNFDEQLRRHIESKIAQHYHNLKVSLRSAELVKGKGIRIHDLTILEPGAEGPGAEILHIDEALFECPTEWKELIEGDPPVHRVTVYRPTLRVTHRHDGTWSAARLLPAPQFGTHPPEVIIDSGVIEICDPLKLPISTHTVREVNLSLVPVQNDNVRGHQRLRKLQGVFTGDGVRHVEIEGLVDMQASTCQLHGDAQGVDVSPELRDSLPNPLASKLASLGDLRGEAKAHFRLEYDPTAATPLKYDVVGELVRGRIDDPHLPHALTDLRAKLHVSNAGYEIDDLVAHSGKGTVQLTCRRSGFDADSPLSLNAAVRQLDLDRSLLSILPPALQDQWHKYLPAGTVDADLQVAFDGRTWHPQMAARCLDVSFTYHKFPYRLEHGSGTVELKDDRLTMNITAYSGSQPIRLKSEFVHPFDGPVGSFEAKGDNIQLNDSILAALPEKSRDVARAFDPHGTVNFYIQTWRDKSNEPMHRLVQLAPSGCSIRYKKFPYPLSNIRGILEMRDGVWTFRNLEGSNEKSRVSFKGCFGPGLEGNELVLSLTGKDVSLKEDLRDALPPNIQQIWHDIRPSGTIDVTAEIRYLAEQKAFSVDVRAEPQPSNVSIELVRFPYRLDHLQGVLQYHDRHVTIQGFKATHGDVKISTDADCDFQPDGRWSIRFTKLWAERMLADRELTQALPERLRQAVEELKPTGPLSLSGNLDFKQTGARRAAAFALECAARIAAIERPLRRHSRGERSRGDFTARAERRAAHSVAWRVGPRLAELQRLSVYGSNGPDLDQR